MNAVMAVLRDISGNGNLKYTFNEVSFVSALHGVGRSKLFSEFSQPNEYHTSEMSFGFISICFAR